MVDIKKIYALLPKSIAGRLECLDNWYRGVPVYDECGNEIGRSAPLISKETYIKLINLPDINERF